MVHDWDAYEYREDFRRCAVCRTEAISGDEYVCSATCSDILALRGQHALDGLLDGQESVRWEGWEKENDCYA